MCLVIGVRFSPSKGEAKPHVGDQAHLKWNNGGVNKVARLPPSSFKYTRACDFLEDFY